VRPILVLVLGFLAALLCSNATCAQGRGTNRDPAKPAPCSVSGMVVQRADSVPLKSATIRLESVDDHTQTFSATTDVGGRFEVTGIEPGRYRLRVIHNGFVTVEYGQRSTSDPGAVLALSQGQDLKDLLFRLVPSGVIGGRIQNEDGDPLPWVRVSALREAFSRGRRRLINEVTVVTDDHGEYRLFGLRPGRYLINAAYRPGQRLDPTEEDDLEAEKSGYVPTYYPGTTDATKAIAITVKTGEEIPSADFLLEPTTVYSIRGHVSVLGMRRSTEGVVLMLEPRTTGWAWGSQTRQSLVDKSEGAFEIPNVLPGAYSLVATWMGEGRRYQARQSVDLGGADADNLQLVLTPGSNVNGQVVWDGKASLEKGNVLAVMARSVNTNAISNAQAPVAPNGSFTLRELPDGTYQLFLLGQTQDCYLKSLRFAGMEASGDEFNVIRGTQATLEVTISTRGARVQGSVTDVDGLALSGVFVVLVPDGERRSEFHLFKQQTTDPYGRFDMRGIAPGDYTLFSWEHVDQNAWQDPEFLKEFEGKGESVSLQEGEGKSVQLTAIRTASQEQQKP